MEFTFRSQGDGTVEGQGLAPGYTVEYKDEGTFMNGGTLTSIPGAAWLLVTMKPASSFEPNPDPTAKKVPTYLGSLRLRWDAFNHLQVVQRLEDVDDTVQWVISLDDKRPFVVDATRSDAHHGLDRLRRHPSTGWRVSAGRARSCRTPRRRRGGRRPRRRRRG